MITVPTIIPRMAFAVLTGTITIMHGHFGGYKAFRLVGLCRRGRKACIPKQNAKHTGG